MPCMSKGLVVPQPRRGAQASVGTQHSRVSLGAVRSEGLPETWSTGGLLFLSCSAPDEGPPPTLGAPTLS